MDHLVTAALQASGQCFQSVLHWRHGDDFRALPSRKSLTGSDPFAAREFDVASHMRSLFRRTMNQKEPGVEAARAERRRHPTAGESEITCVEMKIVMPEKRGPGHSRSLEIIK